MQSRIMADSKLPLGPLQIGATLVTFVKKEEKYISDFIEKEVADMLRGVEGFEFQDFTEAEAKKITADEAALEAEAETTARKALADAGKGDAKDAEKDAEAGLKALAGETLTDGKVIMADGKGEVNVVQAEKKIGEAVEAEVKTLESQVKTEAGDVLSAKTKASRATQKVNGTPSAATPNTPNTANSEGPAAALIANNATDGQPVMSAPVQTTGGDGGTSWGPEDGKPEDALPGTADAADVKVQQEKTKKGENLAPPKDGPQDVGSTKP